VLGSVPNITDISNSWAKDNTMTVVEKKFLTVLDNKFRPTEPITRGEFMYALALATGVKPVTLAELDGKNPFKDVDPKSAVAPYYWAFYKANIVKGGCEVDRLDTSVRAWSELYPQVAIY